MPAQKKRKSKKKRSVRTTQVGSNIVRDEYKRATFTDAQGERQEVLLFDPRALEATKSTLVRESYPELHLDLKRAMAKFNKQEREVLFRILGKHQSVAQATKRMTTRTAPQWRKWYSNVATPQLWIFLSDYYQGPRNGREGRVVS